MHELEHVLSGHALIDSSLHQQAFDEADVVVVSGGNTLFAVGRWNRLGVSDQLRRHADRLVLTGGRSEIALLQTVVICVSLSSRFLIHEWFDLHSSENI